MSAVVSPPSRWLRAAPWVLVAAALAAWPVGAAEPLTLTGETMGGRYSVRVVGDFDGAAAAALHAEIDRRLERVNDQMSTWRPASELSRFNRHRQTDWFEVSPETAQVIDAAVRIGHETGGAFDVTVGPLVNLWRFGPEQPTAPPSEDELAAARAAVGFELLEVRHEPPAVRKLRPDLYVDLSGIAKGHGVDEIARLCDERGATAYLVEIGGEVRTRGVKPSGDPWSVGIESPVFERRQLQRAIHLSGQSLATSGDYRNFREVAGRRVSHIIDPRTGRPVEHRLASVSVVADTCLEADALATALMVLGPDEAYNFATQRNLPVLLIVRHEGGFTERPTAEFGRLFPAEHRSPRGATMNTFVIALLVFLVAMAAMAVGLLGRRRLRGTCGGLAGLKDSQGRSLCDACHDPSPSCGGVADGRQRDADESDADANADNIDNDRSLKANAR